MVSYNPNPKPPGKFSKRLAQVFGITGGNDINVVDTGGGIYQVSYVPKAPGMSGINQDFQQYSSFGGTIATYAHGKLGISDNDSIFYEMCGLSDTVGQTLTFYIDAQAAGTFTTTVVGAWKYMLEVKIRDAGLTDNMCLASFQGAGLSACQIFSNSQANALSLDWTAGKTFDPEFTAGAGNVYIDAWDSWYKPAANI